MTGLWISIATPLIGLIIYGLLVRMMLIEEISNPPIAEYFWLFVFYGGGVQAVLTELFWEWNFGAEMGVLVLVFVAPFYLWFQAYRMRKNIKNSLFHRCAFILSLIYPLFLLLVGIVMLKK